MYKTIGGIYEDGKIILEEKPRIKKSKVIVTFLDQIGGLRIFTKIPNIFKNPVKVPELKKFKREALHER